MRVQNNYWLLYAKVDFVIAVTAMSIVMLPGTGIVKGYYNICCLFLVSATITHSRAIRDDETSRALAQLASIIARLTYTASGKVYNFSHASAHASPTPGS